MRTILSELKRQELCDAGKKKATNCRKASPSMSRREIQELMGVRRDTYVRRKGAIRQK
ncbi:MAG: hypothetical protein ABS948_11965 [Solibacillus sp.]